MSLAAPLRDAGAVGEAEGRDAGARRDEQGVAVAVVVAVELEDGFTARVATGDPDGAHRRLGAGVGHPDHLHRGHDVADELGELDL